MFSLLILAKPIFLFFHSMSVNSNWIDDEKRKQVRKSSLTWQLKPRYLKIRLGDQEKKLLPGVSEYY